MRRPSLIFISIYLMIDDQSYIFTLQATSFVQYYLTRRRQHQMSRSHNKHTYLFTIGFSSSQLFTFAIHNNNKTNEQ